MLNPTLEEIALAAERLGYAWSYPGGVPSAEFIYLHDRSDKKYLVNKTKSPFLSSVHAKLVTDKFLSGQMMAAVGLPVAPKMICTEFSDAAVTFLRVHREVIVKPNRMDRGIGVTDRVSDSEKLKTALMNASQYGGSVVLEKQVKGREYRVLVINGKALAVLERAPLILLGDGQSTVRDLIAKLNQDSKRGYAKDKKSLRPIIVNEDLEVRLQSIGLSLASILEKAQSKQISFSNHLDSGGAAYDCTDVACPKNLKICEEAAKLFSIDVAGIDLICKDISQTITPTDGAAILEVNPGPDILWHMFPTYGDRRPIADEFVKYILEPNARCAS